jgi:threonine dehydrogenase-like Zn-dependent dehydrogenase
MKALVYNGPRDVTVADVDDARIEAPNDVLVKITATNICGSDLHMYEGRTDFEQGRIFGHETSARSSRSVPGSTRSRSGTWSRRRSTSPAGTAATVSTG